MWILLEGLDRSGKSTLAELYHKKGYEIVHLSAPNKKYYDPTYVGPTYLDEMVDLYMSYDGKDVVFDRTIYGELIWSKIFNRTPLLNDEDIDILREFEGNNNIERILMYDPDINAHWQRCVDNNEPLSRLQFIKANKLYGDLLDYGFIKKNLREVKDAFPNNEDSSKNNGKEGGTKASRKSSISSVRSDHLRTAPLKPSPEQVKLEKANAINNVLSRKLIRSGGPLYEEIERDLKSYLRNQLRSLLGEDTHSVKSLSKEEIDILKLYVQRIKDKLK